MKVVAGEQEVLVFFGGGGVEGIREVREEEQRGRGSMRRSAGSRRADVPAHLKCVSRPPPPRKTPPPLAPSTPTTAVRCLRAPPEEPCVLLPGVAVRVAGVAGRLPGLMFLDELLNLQLVVMIKNVF